MNHIIAGEFKGRKLVVKRGQVYVKLARDQLVPILSVQHLSTSEKPGLASGLIRGWLASCWGTTAWISAIRSANVNQRFMVKLGFFRNRYAIAEVDKHVFCVLMSR